MRYVRLLLKCKFVRVMMVLYIVLRVVVTGAFLQILKTIKYESQNPS